MKFRRALDQYWNRLNFSSLSLAQCFQIRWRFFCLFQCFCFEEKCFHFLQYFLDFAFFSQQYCFSIQFRDETIPYQNEPLNEFLHLDYFLFHFLNECSHFLFHLLGTGLQQSQEQMLSEISERKIQLHLIFSSSIHQILQKSFCRLARPSPPPST